ncbi:hypothetical protein CIHG_06457 [Coccidioides immitis H538.4]|uniref:Uncharacterized protein n=1 Tax=Coccidioides immitis H538.4 TaxID=396776 RepID=A0A0J8RXB3_COCIT|nr:hypothetical protein CIHG_06457 [Coccidioides immitis H538.4]
MPYLSFDRSTLFVAVQAHTGLNADLSIAGLDASTLGEIFLSSLLSNLDLLLSTTATKVFRLERALRLELGATVLGNVSVRHGYFLEEGGLRVEDGGLRGMSQQGCQADQEDDKE